MIREATHEAVGEALRVTDPEVFELCGAEEKRQADTIRLIPSENYVSKAVPQASASVFTNKGIRLGSPSVTTRGMGEPEMRQIATSMDRLISDPSDDNAEKVLGEVRELTGKFPAPGISA